MSTPIPTQLPAAFDNMGYIAAPELLDNVLIALVELTNAGSYFDSGFEEISLTKIAKGCLFVLGYALNMYLFSYNAQLWSFRNWDSYLWAGNPRDKTYAEFVFEALRSVNEGIV